MISQTDHTFASMSSWEGHSLKGKQESEEKELSAVGWWQAGLPW